MESDTADGRDHSRRREYRSSAGARFSFVHQSETRILQWSALVLHLELSMANHTIHLVRHLDYKTVRVVANCC